jgi:Uncharacterized protein conserved in bacteria (DUF2188)
LKKLPGWLEDFASARITRSCALRRCGPAFSSLGLLGAQRTAVLERQGVLMGKRVTVEVRPPGMDAGARRGGGTISTHRTKPPAVASAKRVAKAAELGQVVIRNRTGGIQA